MGAWTTTQNHQTTPSWGCDPQFENHWFIVIYYVSHYQLNDQLTQYRGRPRRKQLILGSASSVSQGLSLGVPLSHVRETSHPSPGSGCTGRPLMNNAGTTKTPHVIPQAIHKASF